MPGDPLWFHPFSSPHLLGAEGALQGNNQVPWEFRCSHSNSLSYSAWECPQEPIHSNSFHHLHGDVEVWLEPLMGDVEQGIHLAPGLFLWVVGPVLELGGSSVGGEATLGQDLLTESGGGCGTLSGPW